MAISFFHLETPYGTCQVAESLRKYSVSWDMYLEDFREGPDGPRNLHQVTGISVRAWLCDWKRGKVRVLLGKRAENDSSPNLYEAFGGKCDPKETVLEALIREFWEETKLKVLVIHDEVPEVDVFCTPNSKRCIAQVHFLLSVKPTRESFCGEEFGIKLDPKEHQSFIWLDGNLDALGGLPLTKGSQSHFESAVAKFR
ncbi:uncharacterized protein N7511_011309 [Penicillium nucicola]|uniref:uncharacterized protein n=1 Tax=Penicillium nucicola TaxID=1850975 RepID=UPI002544F8CA|nr:uncharacterized protein N7511_011309 [Penicillium nucicola]KAJ5742577.1 hypothetical protein N7511_011309 [Penicillium nucicola]